jgi:DNA repair exonuclease SbcCD nuclease subunit
MKILYFTDPHIRANSPSSRLDDFPSAILNKLKWIGEYAFDKNIKTIVVGGDWLDRPDTAYSMLNKLVVELLIWKRMGITTYTILGNHDLYGYNPVTFDRTAMSLLTNMGLMTRLTREPIELGDVSLTGVDAYYGLDKGFIEDYTVVKGDKSKIKINVVHGFLDNKHWGDVVSMTHIDDILDTNADITLTGHEHSGFGVIKKNGKIFCNPGSLARVTASIGDISQEVKVAVIDGLDINLVKLPLDIARPSIEVLDREKIEKEKDHISKMSAFSSIISNFQTHNTLNIYTVLDEIAKEENIDVKIIECARKHLERAEEELKREGNDDISL